MRLREVYWRLAKSLLVHDNGGGVRRHLDSFLAIDEAVASSRVQRKKRGWELGVLPASEGLAEMMDVGGCVAPLSVPPRPAVGGGTGVVAEHVRNRSPLAFEQPSLP